MYFELTDELKNCIETTIYKRLKAFEEYLGGVDIEKDISWDGDPCLRVTIHVRDDLDIEAYSKKSLGLGVDIREAMGEKYETIFPYLRLKSFAAEATA